MRDPERACPATTYYRRALAEGRLVAEEDATKRAAALQRMMELHQPEGRHVPLDASHPLYAAALRGLGMWRVHVEALSAVQKLGQDQPAAHMRGILRGLWARGGPGDHAAIEAISAAHPEEPRFADVPARLVPRCSPSPTDARAAARLAVGQYWNTAYSEDQLAAAVLGSTAWVGLEQDGVLVASARAISDRVKRAWVYDVVVHDRVRRSGVGTVLVGLLLDHPALRGTEVNLATRDAADFYTRYGFTEVSTEPGPPFPRTTMRLSPR